MEKAAADTLGPLQVFVLFLNQASSDINSHKQEVRLPFYRYLNSTRHLFSGLNPKLVGLRLSNIMKRESTNKNDVFTCHQHLSVIELRSYRIHHVPNFYLKRLHYERTAQVWGMSRVIFTLKNKKAFCTLGRCCTTVMQNELCFVFVLKRNKNSGGLKSDPCVTFRSSCSFFDLFHPLPVQWKLSKSPNLNVNFLINWRMNCFLCGLRNKIKLK